MRHGSEGHHSAIDALDQVSQGGRNLLHTKFQMLSIFSCRIFRLLLSWQKQFLYIHSFNLSTSSAGVFSLDFFLPFCLFLGRGLICVGFPQGDPSLPTGADGKALQRQGRNESLVAPPGEEVGSWGIDGIVGDGVGVDPWVASQVDPFMSSLREALLRHRPADVPAYVSAFSADRQRQRQLQREKETVLT